MKKYSKIRNHQVFIGAAAFLGVGLACAPQNFGNPRSVNKGQSSQQGVTVTIPEGAMGRGAAAFGEAPLRVKAGTQVTWINQDHMAHTVTATDGSFDSGKIESGGSFTRQFTRTGEVPYHSALDGEQSMSGTVVVLDHDEASANDLGGSTGGGSTGMQQQKPMPKPTQTPKPTPSPKPTPTKTLVPGPKPTQTVTPLPSPTHTVTPSPSPTLTGTPGQEPGQQPGQEG